MSNDRAISINNLSKKYKLYDTPLARLSEAVTRKKRHQDFWALRDVSFEIFKGETVGIIGENGSGKSTLLQIICGVLQPTHGELTVDGRVSALLELGAGFHPEFTGRENVYMAGALMGFEKAEMDDRFQSIVDFSGIGDFIERPVRTYSSGMFVRLAFACAIHVDPDVLLVDEALSVGDTAFQFKCMRKIQDFLKQKKTIIFVSHSMQTIRRYCTKAALLHAGRLMKLSDNVQEVILDYESIVRKSAKKSVVDVNGSVTGSDLMLESENEVDEYRIGSHEAVIQEVCFKSSYDVKEDLRVLTSGQDVYLEVLIQAKKRFASVIVGVSLRNKDGDDLWGDNSLWASKEPVGLEKGSKRITFKFKLNLNVGEYFLVAGLIDISGNDKQDLDQRWPLKKITVISSRPVIGPVYAPATLYQS